MMPKILSTGNWDDCPIVKKIKSWYDGLEREEQQWLSFLLLCFFLFVSALGNKNDN